MIMFMSNTSYCLKAGGDLNGIIYERPDEPTGLLYYFIYTNFTTIDTDRHLQRKRESCFLSISLPDTPEFYICSIL